MAKWLTTATERQHQSPRNRTQSLAAASHSFLFIRFLRLVCCVGWLVGGVVSRLRAAGPLILKRYFKILQ